MSTCSTATTRSGALVAPVAAPLADTPAPAVTVSTWSSPETGPATLHHAGPGTTFLLVHEAAILASPWGEVPLPGRSYAVMTEPASIVGGAGVAITHEAFRGLFQVGGPVEPRGRLRYIDGCSDTILVAPVVCGDPCLNLLHVPHRTVQSDHEHPSVRIGLVVAGAGTCVLDEVRAPMVPGTVFVLPPRVCHRFETADDELLLMAWHPDSTSGPTDDAHPMLDRTLRPGTTERLR